MCLLSGALPPLASAQEIPIRFEQISLSEGLSLSQVFSVMQDEKGFIWVGTGDGLNRYDGYGFRIWRSGDRGLTSSNIWALSQAQDHGLWVGTIEGGLHRLDLETEQFEKIDLPPIENADIQTIWEAPNGNVWLGTRRKGVFVYSPKEDTVYAYPEFAGAGEVKRAIYDIQPDKRGFVWIASYAGIYIAKLDSQTFLPGPISQHFSANNTSELTSNGVRCFAPDGDEGMWIGVWSGGLLHYSFETEKFKAYHHQPSDPGSLSSDYVSTVFVDETQTLWVGTFDRGLNLLKPGKTAFERFQHKAGDPNHLNSNFVSTVTQDRGGQIWIGTYGAGLHTFSPYRTKFSHIRQQAQQVNSLSNNLVFEFVPSTFIAPGQYWVATHGGGINLYDPQSQRIRIIPYEAGDPNGLSNEVTLTALEDRQNRLWIGTRTGLDRAEGRDVQAFLAGKIDRIPFTHFRYDPQEAHSLYSSFVWSLLEDSRGDIWVGSRGALCRFRPETQDFEVFRKNNGPLSILGSAVISLMEGPEGDIWAGTYQGLSRVHMGEKGKVDSISLYKARPDDPHSLPHPHINDLTYDSLGRIWVSTEKGLAIYTGNEGFQPMPLEQEESVPPIKGLAVDLKGNLWASTYRGILQISLSPNDAGRLPVRQYDVKDGLQSNEFHQGAAYCSPEGRLFFGGVEGFSSFFPQHLIDNPYAPQVALTHLYILNEEVRPGEQDSRGKQLIDRSLAYLSTLNLGYQEDILQLDFSALSYVLPEKNRYRFQLVGFDENWVEAGGRHTTTYTNLDPGSYTFQVQAANHDGVWGKESQLLQLEVASPPWRSWWAYLIYGLAIVGLIGAYVRFQVRKREAELRQQAALEQTRREERERVRKRSAQDFHDELGNRLTRISLYTTLAGREQPDPQQQSYLTEIQTQTQALSDGVRDLLWVLDPERDSLLDTLIRIRDFGEELFAPVEIQFVSEELSEAWTEIELPLETRRHLVLLCKEALHNALKYSQAHKVLLGFELKAETLILRISDDGAGFDPDQVGKGYGLKNMAHRAKEIGGTWELHSKPGQGTRIQISLPIPHMRDGA